MIGSKAWSGHPALSRPLTILGVERRWFLLSLTFGLAMWIALDSIVTGFLITGTLYAAGLWAWSKDPQMLLIISRSTSSSIRYDPGKEPSWHLDVLE